MNRFWSGIALGIIVSLCALVWSESPCELPDGTVSQECVP